MFNINQKPTFTREVQIPVPVDDGHENQSIKVTFLARQDAELAQYNTRTLEGQKQMLRDVILSIEDIVDDEGQPVPYSPGLLEKLMSWTFAVLALLSAYSKSMADARLGN
ncbi:phage tail assembly chaperone [Thalassococcus sp. S3]|uniref:phage tail assembly chaperone n=1 Tax=Thalassococcus sp. S3 TaxID=2017482 RepID=UPI0010242443|nr:phage tail assembly chaperone [Thalassococcus sp. S3]QBF31492.1 hypothetical protein CFI11_09725 [Thalassococcus sp. S3]